MIWIRFGQVIRLQNDIDFSKNPCTSQIFIACIEIKQNSTFNVWSFFFTRKEMLFTGKVKMFKDEIFWLILNMPWKSEIV